MQIFRRFAIAACAWVSLAGLAHAASSGPSQSPQSGVPAAGALAVQPPLVNVNWGQAHGITTAQNGFNKYENVIGTSNASTLTQLWHVLSSGVTISGPPVVVGNRVYVTGEDTATSNYNLYAFNAANGTPVSGYPKINVSGASPSISLSPPVAAGGSVYVATRNGSSSQLFAFNAATGAVQSGYPVALDHSAIPQATVGGGNVYQPAGYKIFGFNAKTGLGLANYPITAPNKFISAAASLVGITIGGNKVNELCVGSADNYLYCFDAATGDQLFKVKTSGFFNNGGPAVSGGVIYFISWGEHKLHAVDATTGAEKWPAPLSLTYASNSTPAIASGRVVIGDHGGTLYSVDAATGAIKWQVQPDKRIGQTVTAIDGSAVIANGVIYVNTAANLFAIKAGNGAVLWHAPNPGGFNLTPVVVNGAVFAVSSTGGLSAFTTP